MSCSHDDSELDDYDEDEEFDTYYQDDGFGDTDIGSEVTNNDPESFDFQSLLAENVDKLLNEGVAQLQAALQITPALAKLLLHIHKWDAASIISRYRTDPKRLLVESKLFPALPVKETTSKVCGVCIRTAPSLLAASCGHSFCKECWVAHMETQIHLGLSTGMECMGSGCEILLQEDWVLAILDNSQAREKYQRFTFEAYVSNHPMLRFCPGAACSSVIFAKEKKARKVVCTQCSTCFCFGCGIDYHAPTACTVIKEWLIKCVDDSETANYISANTKDCPECHVCIEKNGGCNHMQCSKCKYNFCWMCLGDWRTHGGEYYECSRYKENPDIAQDKSHQARDSLIKYLHYFTRWENHANSLKLEVDERKLIKRRIEQKVLCKEGTWIDWQYLLDATELLRKCRYTLQYTYPYAYYLDRDPRKNLFEYQQGKLEAEVENLSWQIQKAEITDRGDLENQMNVAEKMRMTLLKDFLQA